MPWKLRLTKGKDWISHCYYASICRFSISPPNYSSFRYCASKTQCSHNRQSRQKMPTTFDALPERLSFPAEEERILQIWKEKNTFKQCLERSKGSKRFSFFDGPPFATGLPHYGHILAGTIKDVVTRYAHQTGHHVERRFGWDCHGLPIEFEIDKSLGIKTREEVIEFGIAKYNEECRSIVMRYSNEWRRIVERVGRWIDFDNDYKTMNLEFMESVWWVFKQLFEKKLVYRAFKVMPFSTACATPLSNFEANQNYKDTKDPSIVVKFDGLDDDLFGVPIKLLAWTTTPWTLPANLALCMHPQMEYVLIEHIASKENWILLASRLEWLCSQIKTDISTGITIKERFPGSRLSGLKYKPLFDFFSGQDYPYSETGWRVIVDNYVTDESGTGVVHCAPAFGEDDYRVCKQYGILKLGMDVPCPINDSGVFLPNIPKYSGSYIKDADKAIKQDLKNAQRLLYNGDIQHSYPFCWRSDTPLIYKAVPSWFVHVESLKSDLIAANKETYWVPQVIQEKRFHNWLVDARDWCISRNRFWGTPIPLWTNEDFSQIVCIGSVKELEQYAGRSLNDIHRHCIDDIVIPDPRGPEYPPLRRIDEVFDCWFESGSMPFAQQHYPFEHQEEFNTLFPADFIGEGIDQTRGWFYTLMVLSTAVMGKPPFKNLIVNGLVLASDGRKMSKRLKNYPDPMDMINQYGADALRLYLVNSPVVKAETLKFKAEGLNDVIKDIFLPWYHATRFFVQECIRYESKDIQFVPCGCADLAARGNEMDNWILSYTQHLIKFVREEFQAYRLYTIVPRMISFLEHLTNWYVRLNRDRMRGTCGEDEALVSLQTLFEVLLTTVILMAPLTPFLSEYLYQTLRRAIPQGSLLHQESVHFILIPEPQLEVINESIERKMERMFTVINYGRVMRERKHVSLKTPVKKLMCIHKDQQYLDDIRSVEGYIKDELNTLSVELSEHVDGISYSAQPNFKVLGSRLGKDMKKVQQATQALTDAQLEKFLIDEKIEIEGYTLTSEDMIIHRSFKGTKDPDILIDGDRSVIVMVDFSSDPTLQRKALAREIANRVQKLRKQVGLQQHHQEPMYISSSNPEIVECMNHESQYIDSCLRRSLIFGNTVLDASTILHTEEIIINELPMTITLLKGL